MLDSVWVTMPLAGLDLRFFREETGWVSPCPAILNQLPVGLTSAAPVAAVAHQVPGCQNEAGASPACSWTSMAWDPQGHAGLFRYHARHDLVGADSKNVLQQSRAMPTRECGLSLTSSP